MLFAGLLLVTSIVQFRIPVSGEAAGADMAYTLFGLLGFFGIRACWRKLRPKAVTALTATVTPAVVTEPKEPWF